MDSTIITALIGFVGGIIGGALSAFLGPYAVGWWQARATKQLSVSVTIENRRLTPWIWTIGDPDETGPPDIETIVVNVRVPHGAATLALERCELRLTDPVPGRLVTAMSPSGTAAPIHAEPGRRYEWTTDADAARKTLRGMGYTRTVALQAVVVDELGEQYRGGQLRIAL